MKKTIHPVFKISFGYWSRSSKMNLASESWYRYSYYQISAGTIIIGEYCYPNHPAQTEFSTVVNGNYHRMTIHQIDIGERRLKNLATRFLHSILQKKKEES